MTDLHHDWMADLRPLDACLRDWAGRNNAQLCMATWVTVVTGQPRRTVEGWLAGRRSKAESLIRRLMTYHDRFGRLGD